jgi:hypothetical protein
MVQTLQSKKPWTLQTSGLTGSSIGISDFQESIFKISKEVTMMFCLKPPFNSYVELLQEDIGREEK